MLTLFKQGLYLLSQKEILEDNPLTQARLREFISEEEILQAHEATITHSILKSHNTVPDQRRLRLRFDALASHDITFVGIIQTAKVSGLEKFPLPYVLTNCHNSLNAVGGTINEDDHLFGLTAAKKYGGVYVPPHLAVIHSYMRETMAGCGKMILGSDSHTRYGALGTLAVGEGGGELVKQLLNQTYDIDYPPVIAVYLTGRPQPGVGPQDIALAIIGAVFDDGLAKNAVLEFVGDGVGSLSADYRCGIDVMTTETTCWSSIWQTDNIIKDYLALHHRADDYKKLEPGRLAYYDGMIKVDMSDIRPMIALPFHPSNTYEIDTLNENLGDILHKVEKETAHMLENPDLSLHLTDKIKNGKLRIDQGIIAGCAGGIYSNLMAVAAILKGHAIGNDRFSLSIYPASQPVLLELLRNGSAAEFTEAGAILRTSFCGPCFGAGDVPANQGLSIRHTTRNFPNREGSRPADNQIASVALMDARSIAATAINGGYLTSAASVEFDNEVPAYHYNDVVYKNRVYYGVNNPLINEKLQYGPNIVDWPNIQPLGQNLLIKIVSYITDPVTTTDEIIPSGETSSFRSNPLGLAEYTLSRKDPAYVGRAKQAQQAENARIDMLSRGKYDSSPIEEKLPELVNVMGKIHSINDMTNLDYADITIGSAIFAVKPGDGSAREQAASCQRVLGALANFANEYATKRYRSNLINWGLIPFVVEGEPSFKNGDYIFIPDIIDIITAADTSNIPSYVISERGIFFIKLSVAPLTKTEKDIILEGCLINYNRKLMLVH
ncbi:MAG: hydratase [Syntrophomonadaceae bacterium]|jgi:aconitate hydratase|nr:hydratase [Syntrophomonadaceae bacterium]